MLVSVTWRGIQLRDGVKFIVPFEVHIAYCDQVEKCPVIHIETESDAGQCPDHAGIKTFTGWLESFMKVV